MCLRLGKSERNDCFSTKEEKPHVKGVADQYKKNNPSCTRYIADYERPKKCRILKKPLKGECRSIYSTFDGCQSYKKYRRW
jgi:hypothetical protein